MNDGRNIRCVFNFGYRGKFVINLKLSNRDLFGLRENRVEEHSVDEFIKQLAIEYIIGLRSTIEQANPDMNYDNLVYVDIDGQKVDAKEIHRIMNQKADHLTRHKDDNP